MTTTLNYNKLHSSVASGQFNQVQRLISTGSNPHTPHSVTGLLPIHFAASRGHVNLVQFLIESCQVDIDAIDKEDETALLKAAYAGHLSVIQYLIENNANPVHQDRDGWTALHNACSYGNLESVVFLLNQTCVDVNVMSMQGHTPLMNAASKGHTDIVLELLNGNYGTNPILKNKFGETAYDVAAAAGEAYLCQLIEQHEHQWFNYHNQIYDTLDLHVTIPVLLVEEQQQMNQQDNISHWYFNQKPVLNKSKVDLPNPSWFWLTDWTIDYTIPTEKNEEGWVYNQVSNKRRQWIRIMKKSMNELNLVQPTEVVVEEEEEEDIITTEPEEDSLLTRVSTTVPKAVFIGCSHNTKPLLQEQIENNEPLWESNDQVVDCRRCHRGFNFIIRKHHCRKCGQIVCDKCSTQRVYLPPSHIILSSQQDLNQASLKPQRICDECLIHVHNDDLIPPSSNNRKKSSTSIMLECPVCAKKLTEYGSVKEQEEHVQDCFNQGSTSTIGIRFVVYKLTSNSALIGQECVICFEEFEPNDTITRLNCMCSYHGHCINTWFSKGKECPIHSQ